MKSFVFFIPLFIYRVSVCFHEAIVSIIFPKKLKFSFFSKLIVRFILRTKADLCLGKFKHAKHLNPMNYFHSVILRSFQTLTATKICQKIWLFKNQKIWNLFSIKNGFKKICSLACGVSENIFFFASTCL